MPASKYIYYKEIEGKELFKKQHIVIILYFIS